MNRVVITGMGVVSPVGNDVSTFWSNLKSGVCGIAPITRIDTENYRVKVAGEVRGFDPQQYMEKLDVLHSDLYSQFAMAAACQAMEDSGLAGALNSERTGVYIGTGIGGIATFMSEHKKLLEKGPKKVSPYFIPMMIANMASGMIAMRFGCKCNPINEDVARRAKDRPCPPRQKRLRKPFSNPRTLPNSPRWSCSWESRMRKALNVAPLPKETPAADAPKSPIAGMTIVVTGKVEPYTRDQINAFIVLKGGIAGSSVTSKTDCLVWGEKAGNKLQKAKELGKIILTPDQFFSLFESIA